LGSAGGERRELRKRRNGVLYDCPSEGLSRAGLLLEKKSGGANRVKKQETQVITKNSTRWRNQAKQNPSFSLSSAWKKGSDQYRRITSSHPQIIEKAYAFTPLEKNGLSRGNHLRGEGASGDEEYTYVWS